MTDRYEPIPFMGIVDVALAEFIQETYGNNLENMPKYIVLGDGAVYIYQKEEHYYALRNQAETVQERIPATEGAGRTASSECSGEGTLCVGQEGHRSEGEGH
jgi:hypothetical protein